MFVLADAGMGKTSLLVMLKFSHLTKFWPSDVDFQLLKLGSDTRDRIAKIEDKRNTVLLLDALDEDEHAIGRIEQRLLELLDATSRFRQVLITCRTQYFPDASQSDFGKIAIGGFICNVIYLSPLSDGQVDAYIRNVFPRGLRDYVGGSMAGKKSRRVRARATVLPMQSLRMRPLLLSYVEDLVDADLGSGSEYQVYRVLIDRWLSREERKLRGKLEARRMQKDELWHVCQLVADHLNEKRSRTLPLDELAELIKQHENINALSGLDIGGRSLLNRKSDGSFRFAHYTIQEFFLAHRVINESMRGDLSSYVATDQVIAFFVSWYRESPRARQAKLRRFLELRRHDGLSTNLTSLDLSNADLHGCALAGTDFSRCRLERANLQGADLQNAKFVEADLKWADFSECNLHGADLSKSDLSYARFILADVTGAILNDATVVGADFTRAKLTNAQMRDVVVGGAEFAGAALEATRSVTRSNEFFGGGR